jgi:hypothetical protein
MSEPVGEYANYHCKEAARDSAAKQEERDVAEANGYPGGGDPHG